MYKPLFEGMIKDLTRVFQYFQHYDARGTIYDARGTIEFSPLQNVHPYFLN